MRTAARGEGAAVACAFSERRARTYLGLPVARRFVIADTRRDVDGIQPIAILAGKDSDVVIVASDVPCDICLLPVAGYSCRDD